MVLVVRKCHKNLGFSAMNLCWDSKLPDKLWEDFTKKYFRFELNLLFFCANDNLCLISAGLIANCGNTGILQLPHNHDFKDVKTFLQADNLCQNSGLKLPQNNNQEMRNCVMELQERIRKRTGQPIWPEIWFDVASHFEDQIRHVVCFVRKFNQAMLWWECVHG